MHNKYSKRTSLLDDEDYWLAAKPWLATTPPLALSSIKQRIKKALPSWLVLIRDHRKAHGEFPNIISPRTFNEKILCRNLFDRRPLLTQIADKAAVRSYVEARLGARVLPDLYHLTTQPE